MAIETISIKIKSNAKEIEKYLADIDSQIKKLKNTKADIQLRADKLETAKKVVSDINVRLKELEAKKAIVNAETSNVGEANEKLAELTVQMDKLRARKAVLQVTTEELKGTDLELNNLNQEMTQLDFTKARLQFERQEVDEIENSLGKLKSMLIQISTTQIKIDASVNLNIGGSESGDLSAISTVAKTIQEAAQSLQDINDKVPGDLSKLVPKLANMALAIGGMGALVAIAGALESKNSGAAEAGLKTISAIAEDLKAAAEGIKQIDEKVPDGIKNFAKKIANMAIAIGGMGVLVAIAGTLASKNTEAAEAGFKAIASITESLTSAAEAMKQIDEKVPDGIKNFAKKVANMAIAIVAMGALVTIAGYLASKNSEAAEAGFKTITSITESLTTAAEAMKQIDEKVPDGIKNFAKKVANMAIAIVAMGVLVTIAGVLASKNTEAAEAGLKTITSITENLTSAAEAMKQIDEKVPNGIKNFAKKIANMAIAIVAMGVLVAIAGVLASKNPAAAAAGLAAISAISENLLTAAEAMKQINEKVPDGILDFTKKMLNMAIAIGIMGVLVAAVGALMATGIGAVIAGAGLVTIALIAADMILVAEAIRHLDESVPSDLTSVKEKIENVAEVIGYFTEASLGSVVDLFGNIIGTLDVAVVTMGISKMTELVSELEVFDQVEIPDGVEEKIRQVEDIIESFGGTKLADLIGYVFKNLDISLAISSIEKMIQLADKFEAIEGISFNSENVKKQIDKINDIVSYIGGDSGGLLDKLKSLISNFTEKANLAQANEAISQLIQIGYKLEEINEISFDTLAVEEIIRNINTVIGLIGDSRLVDLIKAWFKTGELAQVTESVNTLIEIRDKLNELVEVDFKYSEAVNTISKLKIIMSQLGDESLVGWLASIIKTEQLEQVRESIVKLIEIAEKLDELVNTKFDKEAVDVILANVNDVITQMNAFPSAAGLESIQALVQSFSDLINQLNDLTGQFEPVGKGYGEQVIAGFVSADVKTGFLNEITKAISALELKAEAFRVIGDKYGKALKGAFTLAIQDMHKAVDSEILALNDYTESFRQAGQSLGISFVTGFDNALVNLNTIISRQVDDIQNQLASISALNLAASIGYSGTTVNLANGGQVPEYHSGGGLAGIFKRKGTDTVPAMLTPGEYIQNRKAVSTFGLDFMNRVNNLDIHGAFRALTGRFSSYSMMQPVVSSMVNNMHNTSNSNNNNARVTQNIHSGNPDYSMRRASRYLRARI